MENITNTFLLDNYQYLYSQLNNKYTLLDKVEIYGSIFAISYHLDESLAYKIYESLNFISFNNTQEIYDEGLTHKIGWLLHFVMFYHKWCHKYDNKQNDYLIYLGDHFLQTSVKSILLDTNYSDYLWLLVNIADYGLYFNNFSIIEQMRTILPNIQLTNEPELLYLLANFMQPFDLVNIIDRFDLGEYQEIKDDVFLWLHIWCIRKLACKFSYQPYVNIFMKLKSVLNKYVENAMKRKNKNIISHVIIYSIC